MLLVTQLPLRNAMVRQLLLGVSVSGSLPCQWVTKKEIGIVKNIFDLIQNKIEKARSEFEMRISPGLDRTKIFNAAFVNVLIKRAYKYMEARR